ncbi:DEAD/DEAH box helicase family protein [Rheinheimera sp. MM224]|uniref:DEAD/DEAH box helicase family protein n=1 Tax=Rheinheimera sp. MM224 TaxID=3019969 RepID=UPI0021F8657C|nr:DEAD/DEAH box helicase family protein [Rheinheimera sp. MM224]CAI3798202.1 hypothetical protein JAMGFMIE_02012 [Rheinheimera sp. MM224]
MSSKASLHRDRIEQVLQLKTFEHQRHAAQKVYQQFELGHRAVILTAEMQSGKSGIALTLGGLQRLSLSDSDICDRSKLKDTLFLVTMADVALQEQAAEDLAHCPNMIVSNLVHFQTALLQHFKQQPPKLLIIDECHYGSASDAIRYAQLFDYIEKEASETRIALISATPFSALFAAGSESILRQAFNTALVFHKTPTDYHGIRQMHKRQQIVDLFEEHRAFADESIPRSLFLKHLKSHPNGGWALIRVGNNSAQLAKQVLIKEGFRADQIFIVGQKLTGIEDHELVSLTEFRRQYQNAQLFDEKIIAITVASFRAGINFGIEMKDSLIASWDSTVSNIAAVVQANIGRASGYHHNTKALHFTNLKAVAAYTEFLNTLEAIDTTSNFEPITQLFENICETYQVNGFDRGMKVLSQKQPQALVSKLTMECAGFGHVEFLDLTGNPQNKEQLIANAPRCQEALESLESYYALKPGIAVRTEQDVPNKPVWLSIHFIDGQSFDQTTPGGVIQQLVNAGNKIQEGELVSASDLGCQPTTEVMVFVIDCNNLAPDRDAFSRRIAADDLAEFCQQLGLAPTQQLLVIFTQSHDKSLTIEEPKSRYSRLLKNSVFDD